MANLAEIVVHDRMCDQFLAVDHALSAARHDQILDLREPAVMAKALDWRKVGPSSTSSRTPP